MAILKHLQTGADVPLAARTIIGRSRTCQLQIDLANVSALHAEFTWDSRAWHLRDLGSRNGTFVAGRRIPPGHQVMLDPGAEIGFGAPSSHYRFVEDSAPQLMAFGPGDEIRVADNDLLCLPSSAEPEAMILRDSDGRWVIESSEATRPLQAEEVVVVAGRPYSVHLPGGVLVTRDAQALREEALEEGVFEFLVSRDGEHVDLCLRDGDCVRTIESRAHTCLLLALARARLADRADGQLPESEHGWMHRDDVMKELAVNDPQLLNLWVYRARQQFAQTRLRGASRVIERREGAGQLRIGFERVHVVDV